MISCQLMVALAAEAKPLIDHYGLQPERNQRYRSYSNGSISLVESGIGKLNAAAAMASALERNTKAGQKPVCVNIGIAGAERDIGELLAAHRVVDDTTQQSWHPQLTAVDLTETASVVTVSSPSTNYQADTAFDMEAAGFLTAATRYSTLEFIQCLKIVSDNSRNPLETLDKGKVTQLISDQVPNIVQVIEGLLNLHQTIPDNSVIMQLIADCKKTMKISATQESTLLRLLQRFEVIEHRLPTCQELNQQPNTKALLTKLASTLDNRSGKY